MAGELVELLQTGVGGGHNGEQDASPGGGNLIAVRMRDLLKEAVRPEHTQFPADGSGTATPFDPGCDPWGVKQGL